MKAHTRDELEVRFLKEYDADELKNELNALPSLFGGDGRSPESPIFVNTISRALAKRLTTDFIAKQLGREGRDWKAVSVTVTDDAPANTLMERHIIETPDGERTDFYFDLSRIRGNNLRLLRQAFELQLLGESNGNAGIEQ